MKNNTNSFFCFKNVLGVLLIILGFLFNEFILRNFLSSYSLSEFNNRFPFWLADLIFIVSGLFLIFTRFDRQFFINSIELYKNIAMILFNTLILFILVNVGLFLYFNIRDLGFYRNQIFLKYSEPLDKIYPYLKSDEINELLWETWSRSFIFEPYTLFKERPFKGKYVNVSENGFRIVKDQGPWPPDTNNFNIFLFGGSTTFNYGVPDDHTIASRIQQCLSLSLRNKRVCVYNFGRGNYFSSQERVLFEKLLSNGYMSDLAIFIDGINDFYYYNDEPLYTDKLARFVETGGGILFRIPLLKLLEELRGNNKHSDLALDLNEEKYNKPDLINDTINRYLANKKLMENAGKAFGVKTLFVWQPAPTYNYDLKYHRFAKEGFGRFTYSKFGYKKMAEIKDKLGSDFLWLADIQQDKQKALYVDIDHYNSELSQELAFNICNFLIKNNLVK